MDIEINQKTERQWIRSLLQEWGIWHNMTHNLPPHARLATGGNDIQGSPESLEITHKAVIHLRDRSHPHYKLICYLYIPTRGRLLSQSDILKDDGKLSQIQVSSGAELSRMRTWAENKIAAYRQGYADRAAG